MRSSKRLRTLVPVLLCSFLAALASCRGVAGLGDLEFKDAGGAGGGGGGGASGSGGDSTSASTGSPQSSASASSGSSSSSGGGGAGGGSPQTGWGAAAWSDDCETSQGSSLEIDLATMSSNIVMGGTFTGSFTFPGGGATLLGSTPDVFLGLYAASDPLSSVWGMGVSGDDEEHGLGVAARDNSLAHLGSFSDFVSFAGVSFSNDPGSSPDIFVTSYDIKGGFQWAVQLYNATGIDPTLEARSIAVSPGGDVYIAGRFKGSIGFMGNPVNLTSPPAAGIESFVAKISASGTPIWLKSFGSDGDDQSPVIAADATGVFAGGAYSGVLTVDGTTLPSAGMLDGFVVSLSSTAGAATWITRVGGQDVDQVTSVAARAGGGLAVAGSFSGFFDVAGKTLMSAGETDAFAASLTNDGGISWAERIGGAGADVAYDIVEDGAQNLAFTGVSRQVGSTNDHVLLVRLSAGGLVQCIDRFGDEDGSQEGRAITIDSDGSVYVAGPFSGTLDFGAPTGPLSSKPTNLFLAKFPSSECLSSN